MAAKTCRLFYYCMRCDYFSVRLLFLRKIPTFTLNGKQLFIFMLSEMFSEKAAVFSKIALTATVLNLRELFRRIKTDTARTFWTTPIGFPNCPFYFSFYQIQFAFFSALNCPHSFGGG